MNKKIFTLFILLLLLPVMALAVDAPTTLYVGETDIATGGYWKTTTEGKLEPGSESDYNVYYDGNGTLTLNNAKIQGRGYSGNPQPEDYGIYAAPTGNQSVSLTINLMGSNTVSGYCGICVETTTADNASLVIQPAENDPQGSLEAIGNKYNGITISSGSGNASLTINNAPVVAISKSPAPNSYHGVCIKTGIATAPALSLLVNGGSLTAQGESGYGIYFYMRDSTTDPSTSLTVQNNALVKATPSIVTSNNLSKPDTTAGSESGGIVFDGKNGTVYGDVELQDDLEIGTDETLTIPDGSSLDTNGKLTNDGMIINNGTLTGEVGGSGTVTPKITTDSLPNGTVGESYTATLEATGNNITWSASGMPDGLTLNSDGTITGTPTTADTYTFTVTATNASGSASKEFTLAITSVSVTDVTLDKAELSLFTGESVTLTATVKPDNATNKNVTWENSNPDVVTVADGVVTAVKEGEATITVTTTDGSGKFATCKVTVEHTWGDVSYTWSKDDEGNQTCTATRTCQNDASHTATATATVTSKQTKDPTCTEKGETTYTATFIETWASEQTKTEDIPALGHDWGKTVYKWSEYNTACTATRTCKNDASHTATAEATVTSEQTQAPTCTEPGKTTYTATFKVNWAKKRTKTVADIPATGHHYVNGYCTECGHRDPDYRPDPISYYNIYVEDVCDGVEVSTSKQVVREGGSITVYVEKDTANYTFDNFKVYYKRSYYGGWEELKEGTQSGEYPIKNIWTHIYIKAEGAEEKEDPTGIESIEGVKVYTKDGSLYVQTLQREQVIIVSMSGAVVKNEEQIGLKQYHGLQPGIYIVRVGDRAYKVRLN